MATSPQSIPNKSIKTEADQELVMTYGMFTDIMRLIGEQEDTVSILMTDANVRDLVIRRLFTPMKKAVENVDELINPYEIDISPLELDSIIAWVADHVMHFTISTAEKTRPVVEKYQDRLNKAS